jgi:hypothetical protein
MATVKTTQAIISAIGSEINTQFNKRRDVLHQRAKLDASDSEYFMQSVINLWLEQNGSSRAAFEAVPRDAFPTVRRCRIDRLNGLMLRGFVDELDFPREVAVPHAFGHWSGASFELETGSNPFVSDIMHNIEQVSSEREELENERRTMRDTVDKILTAFPTINKAIEYWPPLANLLPQDIKERLEKKVERKKVEQDLSALNDISLDSINVSLVRNKLATA